MVDNVGEAVTAILSVAPLMKVAEEGVGVEGPQRWQTVLALVEYAMVLSMAVSQKRRRRASSMTTVVDERKLLSVKVQCTGCGYGGVTVS